MAERSVQLGDAADRAGASDGALQLIARLAGSARRPEGGWPWLWRASAGPTAPRLPGAVTAPAEWARQ